MNKREAGRLGGITTRLRAGSEGMSERGKLGGRPRLPALAEAKGQQSASSLLNEKEARLPTNLKELKMLYVQKIKGGV